MTAPPGGLSSIDKEAQGTTKGVQKYGTPLFTPLFLLVDWKGTHLEGRKQGGILLDSKWESERICSSPGLQSNQLMTRKVDMDSFSSRLAKHTCLWRVAQGTPKSPPKLQLKQLLMLLGHSISFPLIGGLDWFGGYGTGFPSTHKN